MFRNTLFRDAVIEAMPDPVFVFSDEGEYLAVFGGKDAENYHDSTSLIGKMIGDIIESPLSERFLMIIRETIAKRTPQVYEYELSASDVDGIDPLSGPAGRIWFEAKISPFIFEGRACVVWVARNITNTKNLEFQLIESASSDFLTGIYTRRFFFNELNSTYHRFIRSKSIFSVIISDIDDLKKINDSFGEKTGDMVLVHAVSVFKRVLRKSDIAARIGGDEIAVILPDTALDGASFLAERLKYALSKSELSTENGKISVTASFGCSEVSADDTEYDTTASKADIALHMAKLAGKNCVRTVK